MTTCAFNHCHQPATTTYTGGCTCEHVYTESVCTPHARAIRRATASWCNDCEDAGHHCPITLRWHDKTPNP